MNPFGLHFLILCSASFLLLTSCSLAKAKKQSSPQEHPPALKHAASAPTLTRSIQDNIPFEGIAFDSRTHQLFVADQKSGPGSIYSDAKNAGESNQALAAFNAGFFTPTGTPLGLVISQGKSSHSWNGESSLGSGIWLRDRNGISSIIKRDQFKKSSVSSIEELIQAGPMLTRNGSTVAGLETQKISMRTCLLWDGQHRWWLGKAGPCSLHQLAQALRQSSPAGWKVQQALNLDGGRSSDAWASPLLPGPPLGIRPPWNRPVRNFLILKPR